jgi:VRR-NUC domain
MLRLTFPGLFLHHSPNGWYGGGQPWQNARQAAKLKAMGTKNGFPDWLFLIPESTMHGDSLARTGRFEPAFIELKVPDGYLTPEQKEFRDMCHAMNIKWALCRSYEQVRDTLIEWGVQCKEVMNSL